MFVEETIQHCPRCDEVTPHSRRRVAVPTILAVTAGVGALLSVANGSFGLGGVLLAAAAPCYLNDRERYWPIQCERCRGKARHELKKTKPTLDGNTEIQLF